MISFLGLHVTAISRAYQISLKTMLGMSIIIEEVEIIMIGFITLLGGIIATTEFLGSFYFRISI